MHGKGNTQKMNTVEKSNREDRKISFAIILQFCMLITNYAVKEVFQVNNSDARAMISFMFMIVVGIFYLKGIKIVFRRNGKFFILSYILFLCIFLGSAILHTKTVMYLPEVSFWLFIICIPTAQYYLVIRDKSIFLRMLILSGYYQLFLGLTIFISMIVSTPTYDMTFSYLVLVPMIILTYKLVFIKFRMIDTILVIASFISVLTVGSRGPLLAYFIYLILLFVNYLNNNRFNGKTYVLGLFLTILTSFFIMNFDLILSRIDKFLFQYGIQSRTIYLLSSDNVDFSTGRSEIFSKTISNITLNPVFGNGIAGDRVFLNGSYPHNIFLEIIAQFGIFLGGVFSLILLFYWFHAVFVNNSRTNQHLTIIFAGLGLISLFYSGSYLTSSNFWLFMAICISSVHFSNNQLSCVDENELKLRRMPR